MRTGLATDLAGSLDPAELAARLGMIADPWQLEVLRSTDRRVALVIARQVGKTTVAAILAVWTAAYKAGALVLMIAPTQRQSQELFRRALMIYRQLGRPVPSEAENALSLTLENGSRIISLPGEERNVRSYAGVDLLLIDEASRVSDELMGAVEPMVAISGGRIMALSTPFGKRGFFYQASTDPLWRTITVRADQCPRWAKADLDSYRLQRGEWLFRQELMGEFIDTLGQAFRSDDIDEAFAAGARGASTLGPLFGRLRVVAS